MLCNKYNGEIVPFCSFDQANEQKTLNSDENTPIGSKLRELFNNNPVELAAGTYVNVLNNRYCVELYCDMDVDDDIIYDLFKRGYFILLKMTGEGGQVINGFKDEYSPFFSVEDMISSGYITDGMTAELSTNGTINSFCINDDVISVGACYSRREEGYMEEEGNVADFSSWCDFAGSYRKPHLLAPGSYIYAASNRYYSNADDKLQYITVDGKEYPYKGAAGTSMSAPFAAGTIALWLQANPELKPHDVLDIINKTCVKNEYYEKDENKARWGAGIIDAYAGIKEALSRPTNIVDVTANKAIPLVKLLDNKMLEVTVAAGSPCNVKIYSVDGRIVNTASSKENNITIPLTSLTGTYIVNVNGKSMKMVIK